MQPTKEKLIKTLLNKRELWNRYSFSCYKKNKIIDLSNADMRNADMSYADMSNADMRNADMSYANMRYADMSNADMRNADMSYADMSNANMSNANMRYADMSYANMRYADMSNANMSNANMRYADMSYKQLSDYQNSIFKILPEGDIFGYKKILSEKGELIIKIKIPKQAKRLNALSSRKCRAEYAIFDSIVIGDKTVKKAYSGHDNNFKYILKKGFKIIPDSFDENNKECSNGIHFFITQVEAEKY